MILSGRLTHNRRGAPGRLERLLAAAVLGALAVTLVASVAGVAEARMDASDRAKYERATTPPEHSRVQAFYGWYHNVGQLLLHVSNLGFFGEWSDWDLQAPSAEWPAGSGNEYLYAAGLWVGAQVYNWNNGAVASVDTLVSAGVYQREYRPSPDDPLKTIYETWEGAANSARWFDDDGDCRPDLDEYFEHYDEDPLDGLDNDGDGLVDEDYAAISQQMFRCEYEDTYEDIVNEAQVSGPTDLHNSLGVKVIQESYQWTSQQTDDFVGIDFQVVNIGEDTLRMVYVGFMVDADAGPLSDEIANYVDDRGGFIDTLIISVNPNDPTELDTLDITLAYMFDDPYGPDGNIAKGYFGCMFLGHPTSDPDTLQPGNLPAAPTEVRVHAFEIWSSGTEDPDNDQDPRRTRKTSGASTSTGTRTRRSTGVSCCRRVRSGRSSPETRFS